jgi:DNA-binding beta-propeller fold protein YncE
MRAFTAVTLLAVVAVARIAWGATGLANVQTFFVEDVPDISTPESIAISSPDGAFVYVAAPSAGIAVFSRDSVSGKLTLASTVHAADLGPIGSTFRPRGIDIGPGEYTLYVGADSGTSVFVFFRDSLTGALTLIQEAPSALSRMRDLVVSPDGENLYVIDNSNDSLQVFARDSLSGFLTAGQLLEDDQGGVDGLNGATGIAISPDGKHVYVTSSEDKVALFDRDLLTGDLTFVTVYEDTIGDTLTNPNDVVLSPDGLSVYVAPASNQVNQPTVFSRDPMTGLLTFVETGPPFGLVGRHPFTATTRALAVSPDGSKVIGATTNTVSIYDRDPVTGGLTFLGGEAQRGERIEMSPDGVHVYVASGTSTLGVFRQMSIACSPTPLAGCKVPTPPEHSVVEWKGASGVISSKFLWKWLRGEATALAELGDPVNGTDDLILCAYDQSASPQPVFHTVAPAAGICDTKPCWRPRGTTPGSKKLKYKDKDRRPDGLDRLDIKEGADGLALLKAKGKSQFLAIPPLPLTLPLTVQAQSTTGTCFEATYGTFIVNNEFQFKAKQ